MEEFAAKLDRLIGELEQPNPEDNSPSLTRGTLQLLWVLRVEGPEAMMDQILTGHQAALAALRVIAPSMTEAVKLMEQLVKMCGEQFIRQEHAVRREMRQ